MGATTTLTIGELAQAAGVTTRTIRYYVAEGLLPPPLGGGRAASYGDEHLQRLELIKLLKEEFLPLNEIRVLLAGLDDNAVRDLLSQKRQPPPPPAQETAKEYLQALLDPPAASPSLLRQAVKKKAHSLSSSSALAQPLFSLTRNRVGAQRAPVAKEAARQAAQPKSPQEPATVWQRYPLHPDVELHIRQPPSDMRLRAQLDRLIADIRRLIEGPDL